MAGLQRLGIAIKVMQSAVPFLDISSPAGAAVMKALKDLAQHVPPGSVTPAGEKNEMQNLMLRNAQQGQQAQQMRQGGPGAPGGAGAAPPGMAA